MKYLILGGGAMGYYSMLGQLARLEDQNELHDVEALSGASCGSLLLFMYAIHRGNTREMMEKSMELDISRVTKPNLMSIIEKFGFIRTRTLKQELKKFSMDTMKIKNPTMAQVAEFSKLELHIPAFCVTTGRTEYFSNITHKDFKILDIISASIAVPLLFSAQKINKKLYVDGALEEKLPAVPFLSKKWNDVLAIEIESEHKNTENKITDIRSFVEVLANVGLKNRPRFHGIKTKTLHVSNDLIFDFKMDSFKKLELYIKGFSTA